MAFTVAGTDSQFCVRFWFSNHCFIRFEKELGRLQQKNTRKKEKLAYER